MSRVFSTRKGQALQALENALERCEREGLTIIKSTAHANDFGFTGVNILIPEAYWEDNSIFLTEEIGKFPEA